MLYHNVGKVFQSVGDYTRAKENFNKVIVIRKEIGDKKWEASSYGNLGDVFASVSECAKPEQFFQKAVDIRKEIWDEDGEATDLDRAIGG